MQRTLVAGLYTHPMTQTVGNVIGLGCAVLAARAGGIPLLAHLAWAMAGAIALRIVASALVPRISARTLRTAEHFAFATALLYAGLVGALATTAVALNAPPAVQLLLVGFAVGFGTGGATRSAGRPAIAIGQLVLGLLPPALALLYRGDAVSIATAAFMILTIPAMCSTVMQHYRVLHRSIDAAETSGRLAARMQTLARTDVVTGLLNRAGLDEALLDRVGQMTTGHKLALLWLDLDRFKQVNDTMGHQAGDRVLAEVGRRLRRIAPENAAVSRFGGDEFIIAVGTASRIEIEQLAGNVIAALGQPFRLGHAGDPREMPDAGDPAGTLRIGASIGIAVVPDDAADIDSALQAADLALYNAKLNGRNQAVFHTPELSRAMIVRGEIEDELREAMLREELSIYFQPIIDLRTGRIRSLEALIRWFHPERGEVAPIDFIPIAEESGAIISLGNWIARTAARAAMTWPEDVTLAINLSPVQIRAPGAALGILAALRETGLPPQRLELEITESVLLDQNAATEAFIAQLSEAGIRFTMDDFGTGYSSLSRLSRHNFSRIKIDRSFVSGTQQGERGEAILRAVSGMAKALDMELVAEGIETVEQAGAMVAAGCTHGQGWHFSRAVPDYVAVMLLAQERADDGPERGRRTA